LISAFSQQGNAFLLLLHILAECTVTSSCMELIFLHASLCLQLDVAKTAYYQVESMEGDGGSDSKGQDEGYFDDEDSASEEQDKTNSRDVGHNIYILAHQVCPIHKTS